MNKKEILHKCEMIYSVFDDLNNPRTGCQVRDYGEIRSFVFGLLDGDKKVRSIFGKDYDIERDPDLDLTSLQCELFETGFAFGYAIGRLFDTRYPKVENAVKSIQSLLKEKALLPYYPRETSQTPSKRGLNNVKQGLHRPRSKAIKDWPAVTRSNHGDSHSCRPRHIKAGIIPCTEARQPAGRKTGTDHRR